MADLSKSKQRMFRQKLGESLKKKPLLPVTCGTKKGILYKDRYNKGEPCILSAGAWFTPSEFEKFGGKTRNKKWKVSIYYKEIPLLTLIEARCLSSPIFKTTRSQGKKVERRQKALRCRKSARLLKDSHTSEVDSDVLDTESSCSFDDKDDSGDTEDSDDYNNDYDEDDSDDRATENAFLGECFSVECSKGKGVLHVNRFATEACGKCIRTPDAWLTPEEFLNQNKQNGNWRRDITSNGVPLGMLIMKRELTCHMLNCDCPICTQEPAHLLDQNNDDVCFMCKNSGDLVCCEKCPRAFHHLCHRPALSEDTIGEHWTCSYCTV